MDEFNDAAQTFESRTGSACKEAAVEGGLSWRDWIPRLDGSA